jgi:uncharacterized membrane protein YhaH (DUF805 family)
MSRAPFVACALFLAALWAAFVYSRTFGVDPRWGWVVGPLLLFPTACVLSKRLHDRGRAGWWGFVIVWALVELALTMDASRISITLLGYAAVVILIGALVYLVFLPGEPGQNRFGPNPAERGQRSEPTAK